MILHILTYALRIHSVDMFCLCFHPCRHELTGTRPTWAARAKKVRRRSLLSSCSELPQCCGHRWQKGQQKVCDRKKVDQQMLVRKHLQSIRKPRENSRQSFSFRCRRNMCQPHSGHHWSGCASIQLLRSCTFDAFWKGALRFVRGPLPSSHKQGLLSWSFGAQDLHNEQWEADIVIMLSWNDPRVAGLIPQDMALVFMCFCDMHCFELMWHDLGPKTWDCNPPAAVEDETSRTLTEEQADKFMWAPVPWLED